MRNQYILARRLVPMDVLLVEPAYYSKYPPLGLMKISAYRKSLADKVHMVRGLQGPIEGFVPRGIEVTSLFTYAWKPVHEAIEYYHKLYPNASICVGGIYASLYPDRIKDHFPYADVHVGLNTEAEKYMPDYDILEHTDSWKGWDGSIMFTSRGCVNKCPFCLVPTMEGELRSVLDDPLQHTHPDHKRIILWDNNFLALENWEDRVRALRRCGKIVDFNQGLDARLMTQEKADALASLKLKDIKMAYDGPHEKGAVHRAVDMLESAGVSRRRISFYTLYNFYDDKSNFYDTPEEFYGRVKDILDIGCASYPMRYVPLKALEKSTYVSPFWTKEQLEAVAKARRVIGFGGAFPPYSALVEKFDKAGCFDEAFRLEPPAPSEAAPVGQLEVEN